MARYFHGRVIDATAYISGAWMSIYLQLTHNLSRFGFIARRYKESETLALTLWSILH